MKRKYIIVIIFIITVSLIGLVGIQLYWIKSAIQVKESNFDRSVNEAMTNVIYKLEKIDLARQIQTFNKQSEKLFYTIDSLNKQLFDDFKKTINKNRYKQNNVNFYTTASVQFGYTQRENGKIISSFDSSYTDINPPSKIYQGIEIAGNQYTSDKKTHEFEKKINYNPNIEFEKFFNRTDIVSEIFKNLFNVGHQQSIEKRIDLKVLDSLIKTELTNKNINTDYEFGIYNPAISRLLAEKTGKYHNELITNSLKYYLFPNDMFSNPHFLLIYFPFLLRNPKATEKGFLSLRNTPSLTERTSSTV